MLPDELKDYAHADVYLLDQIFKGRIRPGMRVLDVGCGGGRNIKALLALGCAVIGVDKDPSAIAHCQQQFSGHEHVEAFLNLDILDMAFAEGFDVLISNAVFHFAPDQETWFAWLNACWQQIKPGGMLFARLSTRLVLPDANPPGFGYLADLSSLVKCETDWQAQRLDPLKSTAVEDLRCMSTWVLTKP